MFVQVKVKVHGLLKDTLGMGLTTIDINTPLNVRSILNRLLSSSVTQAEFNNFFVNALILLDGVEIKNLHGMDTLIEKDSELIILSVVHGG